MECKFNGLKKEMVEEIGNDNHFVIVIAETDTGDVMSSE